MSRRIHVALLPELIDQAGLPGTMVVVIDVLRASTTAATALAAGARRIIPVPTIEEARRLAQRLAEQGEAPLLAGERGGVRIDGFDLGNSPGEMTSQRLEGRTILFTTTNGTRALLAASGADWVAMGSFANLSAIVDLLARGEGDIHLVCAGTNGEVTLEDVLAAGAIAIALQERGEDYSFGNDSAALAAVFAAQNRMDEARHQRLRESRGGRNVLALENEEDIALCGRLDEFPVIPVLEGGALVAERVEPAAAAADDWSI